MSPLKVIILLWGLLAYGQQDSLIGPVKSVAQEVIYLNPIEKPKREFYQSAYGEFGLTEHMVINQEEYFSKGFTTGIGPYWHKFVKSFSKAGQLTEEVWYEDNNQKPIDHKRIYEYDNGRLTLATVVIPDVWTEVRSYGYQDDCLRSISEQIPGHADLDVIQVIDSDSNCKELGRTSMDAEGVLRQSIQLRDSNGNILREMVAGDYKPGLGKEANFLISREHCYDEEGKKIQQEEYDLGSEDPEYTPSVVRNYEYDENNNLISIKSSQMNLGGGQTDFQYDEENRLIRKEYNSKYSGYIKTYSYNQLGMIATFSHRAENDNWDYSFTYQFDKRGNWISIVKSQDGTPKYELRRKIKYYKE